MRNEFLASPMAKLCLNIYETTYLALSNVGDLDELHIEANVGLVNAVVLHGIIVGHAWERREIDVLDLLKHVTSEALEHVHHIYSKRVSSYAGM